MHMSKTAKSKTRKAKGKAKGKAKAKAKAKAAARVAKHAAKPAARKPAERSPRRSPEAMLAELKRRLLEISDLNFSNAVLGWDQATYMPPGGAEARGRQAAMLSKLAHEKSVDPA